MWRGICSFASGRRIGGGGRGEGGGGGGEGGGGRGEGGGGGGLMIYDRRRGGRAAATPPAALLDAEIADRDEEILYFVTHTYFRTLQRRTPV